MIVGSVFGFALLTAPILTTEEPDLIVYPFQGTLMHPFYVWAPQAQMDDLPAGSGAVYSESLLA